MLDVEYNTVSNELKFWGLKIFPCFYAIDTQNSLYFHKMKDGYFPHFCDIKDTIKLSALFVNFISLSIIVFACASCNEPEVQLSSLPVNIVVYEVEP